MSKETDFLAKKLSIAYKIMICEGSAFIDKNGDLLLEANHNIIADRETLLTLNINGVYDPLNVASAIKSVEDEYKRLTHSKLTDLIYYSDNKVGDRIKHLEEVEQKYNMLVLAFQKIAN